LLGSGEWKVVVSLWDEEMVCYLKEDVGAVRMNAWDGNKNINSTTQTKKTDVS
jgi:hypothetical protein